MYNVGDFVFVKTINDTAAYVARIDYILSDGTYKVEYADFNADGTLMHEYYIDESRLIRTSLKQFAYELEKNYLIRSKEVGLTLANMAQILNDYQ